MQIETITAQNSAIHIWDPRLKIVSISIGIGVIAFLRDPLSLLVCLAGVILLIGWARIPPVFIIRVLRFPVLFLLIMIPVIMVTAGDVVQYRLGPLIIYQEGVRMSLVIALRCLMIVSLLMILFSTARLHLTMQALHALHVPGIIVQLLLFTYRYIFLYISDLNTLRHAVRLRGFSRSRGLARIRTLAALIVNLIVHGFEQSERIAAAMRLRGFTGVFHGCSRFHAGWMDVIKAGLVLSWPLTVLVMELL